MAAAPLTAAASQTSTPDNPAYIQVSAQREASVNERRSLAEEARGAAARIRRASKARLGAVAEVASANTARSCAISRARRFKYREVRQKQMEATLAKNLETERKGERFTLIEPPLAPRGAGESESAGDPAAGRRASPRGWRSAVALLESVDTTIRSRRDVDELLPVAPLAVLPWIETPRSRRRERECDAVVRRRGG